VNRLSFGVQSFDDAELKALERIHTADDVRREVAATRAAGFDNVNLDLIFGLPGQTLDAWRRNLEEALRLEPEHLSAYALTVEEGTALARDVARGRKPPPDPDLQADMYELTEELLASAGYEHYELSNWAKPGRRCRHNLVYWRNGEYLGVGAGAHSYVDGVRFANERLPSRYLAAVNETWEASQGAGPVTMRQVASVEREPAAMQMAETAILGLRLIEGVDLAAFAARFGQRFEDVYAAELPELFSYGLIERSDGHIRLTRRGRLLGNEVFQRLLPATCAAP
jgi:oxygen-independent coproporphyrinogen-3 oxidase